MYTADYLVKRITNILTGNIMDFWINKAIDPETGIPYGQVDSDGFPVENFPVGSMLSCRILWSFSAAYNSLNDKIYLSKAKSLSKIIYDKFFDKKNGGIFKSISAKGDVEDLSKITDRQAYGIYAFSEYFKASGDSNAVKIAYDLFKYVEKNSLYSNLLGYSDSAESSGISKFNNGENLTLNTHLHLMESYTALYSASGRTDVFNSLILLFDLLSEKFYNSQKGYFYSFISSNFQPVTTETIYGMGLETAWLLNEVSMLLSDEKRIKRSAGIIENCASFVIENATDSDYGIFFCGEDAKITNDEKQWWVQAEAAIAYLITYKKTRVVKYFEAFCKTWEFINTKLIDYNSGEWKFAVKKNGEAIKDDHRAGAWKCPYHNTRLCVESLKRKNLIYITFDILEGRNKVTKNYKFNPDMKSFVKNMREFNYEN